MTRKERRSAIYAKAGAIAQDVRTADFPEAVNIIAGLLARASNDRHKLKERAALGGEETRHDPRGEVNGD